MRYLHAFSGIVITASHHPAEYSGFKVYGADGAQFASEDADVIVAKVNEVADELTLPVSDEGELKASGLSGLGDYVEKIYLWNLHAGNEGSI